MSRFLLALKSCFSQIDPVGTLIFDEIDTGVSGRVTQAIAEKLHQLSAHHQVLCVTHQPIVAAIAPPLPAKRYPTKVAVVKTGPGVICPMATASRSC
ncbi:MAG: hypothetical protein RLZZ511_4136 [Cyanobacteriota bacterium]